MHCRDVDPHFYRVFVFACPCALQANTTLNIASLRRHHFGIGTSRALSRHRATTMPRAASRPIFVRPAARALAVRTVVRQRRSYGSGSVVRHKGKFQALVYKQGKRTALGTYATRELAAAKLHDWHNAHPKTAEPRSIDETDPVVPPTIANVPKPDVYFNKQKQLWQARLQTSSSSRSLGYFRSREVAASAFYRAYQKEWLETRYSKHPSTGQCPRYDGIQHHIYARCRIDLKLHCTYCMAPAPASVTPTHIQDPPVPNEGDRPGQPGWPMWTFYFGRSDLATPLADASRAASPLEHARASPVLVPSSIASSSRDTSATASRAAPTPEQLAVHADSVVDLPPDIRLRAKRGADDISVAT